ncbi:aminoacyl-tRNA hydrolase [Exiguobacterium sp. SH3S2]|uniref:aminoacyl-tRNA hydrolase n=1 Tax=Exiguobacterium TaxID=33986 RepID=UPI00087777D4|nr:MULTISPECIES: aminoacyl-tRNA hydrolase [Exiguobacterium]OGX79217.1 aminoacyl-tRNA hydrolase [Exiguobacterium sp. SH31]TCI24768.1 aminoacyl-tRNA hydrolase [Exiguobacterium sp. SH5S4]TCI33136.1 aminoacyl-tRNA hydrolase [Exiguobacterium sp. SH4S7]TCI42256.1 aminoacyl-tRNA hydrolase [Exiguobacterium sp. SH3S3]TCI42300.1 aminoacyl-tRNA hydrolase [Exiguobacterium sp. SH5S32]
MKCIVGLGNPGKKYGMTRHNIGFLAIDRLADKHGITLDEAKFKAVIGTGRINGERVVLVKPLTYMNLSGEAVRPILDYYKIDIDDLLVIYDDLDMVPGKLRLRPKGSAGGHNGIKSLIQHLGTMDFKRLKLGVGRPPHPIKVVDWVLMSYRKEDMSELNDTLDQAVAAATDFVDTDWVALMNRYN